MGKRVDSSVIGKKFNRLTITGIAGISESGKTLISVTCECGNEKVLPYHLVSFANTKSCGCLRREILGDVARTHGLSSDARYSSWRGMIKRCYDKTSISYKNYGGRGITVAPEWLGTPAQFYIDMGNKPKGHSLERMNNDEGYSKENCCWATRKEQQNNRRNTVRLEVGGVTHTIAEWAALSGVKVTTINSRLRRGKSEAQLLDLPITP
jgi:hypothetical protein